MESFYRCQKKSMKEKVSMLFVLAKNTAEHIGKYLNSEITVNQPWDFFPGLFSEEKELWEKETEKREFEEARERRRAYAREWKRQHGEE